MIYQPEYVTELLQKQVEGKATPAETEALLAALDMYTEEEIMDMLAGLQVTVDDEKYKARNWPVPPFSELQERLRKLPVADRVPAMANWFNALSFLLLLVAVLLFVRRLNAPAPSCGNLALDARVPLGHGTCKVVLATDTTLLVDSSFIRFLGGQGVEINQPEPGVVRYRYGGPASGRGGDDTIYYTVTAPKGGQYRLLLPDGSAIRLNAGTSVRFPKAFHRGNRIVELNGEGLFDVATGGGAFVVRATYATLRTVKGRFNIRAYKGGTTVTPLSGGLQAWHSNRSLQLQTGDQLVLSPTGPYHEHYTVQQLNADTAQAVSWTRAQHYFVNISMKDFVEDIGRQYNLELRRLSCIPERRVSVTLCYNKPLEEVLTMFRKWGLICVLQGNVLTFCEPLRVKQLAQAGKG